MTITDKVTKASQPPICHHGDSSHLSATDGLTLEKVLENQASRPFSLREFADYLEQTYCSENLSFYMAVTDYRESARLYFGSSPDTLKSHATVPTLDGQTMAFWFRLDQEPMLNHELQIRFKTLRAKFQDILERFIFNNAPQEVNIPYELRHQLLQTHRDQHCFHPALLKPPCVAVVELMRISAFIPFATDPDRMAIAATAIATPTVTPKPSKSSKSLLSPSSPSSPPRRLRSCSSLSGQEIAPTSSPVPPVPVIPLSARAHADNTHWSSTLSPPTTWSADYDDVSVTSTTSNSSHNTSSILKKITTSLRLRARSQSPPRQTSWKQIIPDPHAFKHAPPAMERGLSNSSITSTTSTTSSSRGSTSNQSMPTTTTSSPSRHHHYHHPFDTHSSHYSSHGDASHPLPSPPGGAHNNSHFHTSSSSPSSYIC
ncbi:hypothetical protein K492DRAFT_170936 [Lichtheimia hyalospora FSU 10163]|nr:hypothetical protein K492DRAFT_170936 [Lichtheimia hyalospora FSU 10163]